MHLRRLDLACNLCVLYVKRITYSVAEDFTRQVIQYTNREMMRHCYFQSSSKIRAKQFSQKSKIQLLEFREVKIINLKFTNDSYHCVGSTLNSKIAQWFVD